MSSPTIQENRRPRRQLVVVRLPVEVARDALPVLAQIALAMVKSQEADEVDVPLLFKCAIHALHEFRRRSREKAAMELDLPVRKAVVASEGGTRFY